MKLTDLHRGDKFDFTRADCVFSNKDDGHFHLISKSGNSLRIRYWDTDGVTISNVRTAEPDSWPPNSGDVWRDTKTDKEYHFLMSIGSTSLAAWDHENNMVRNLSDLKPDLVLVHRRK